MHTVALHFDFISPYSWLALEAAPAFAAEHGVRFELRPVVYGALLQATGLVGPVETDAKRRYTFDDVVRCALRAKLELVGPPSHPFLPIRALRTQELFRDDARNLELARALAAATWSRGRDLTDLEVLADVVRATLAVELSAEELAQRISAPEVKDALRRNTDEALEAGVFGVPTFAFEGELFWGHDRMPHLAERLAGKLPPARKLSSALLERPASVQRR